LVLRSGQGEAVKELERRLKVADPVIKYLTVRLDEELKRRDKLKRHRDRRAARRPRKAVPGAPAAPVAPVTPAGGEPNAASA
jgi:small subunit ribosomal protein S6